MKREEPIDLEEYKGQRLKRKGTPAGVNGKPPLRPEQLRELLDRNISLKVWKKEKEI